MANVNYAWLIYTPAHQHLLPQAFDCAQNLGATLKPVAFTDFIANANKYLAETRHLITLLGGIELESLLYCAYRHNALVGLLPEHAKSKVCCLFGIPAKLEDALPIALNTDNGINRALLLCDEKVVSWMVSLGNISFIELCQIAHEQNLIWRHVKRIPSNILALFQFQSNAVVIGTMKAGNGIVSMPSDFAGETPAT